MTAPRYRVTLTAEDRKQLTALTRAATMTVQIHIVLARFGQSFSNGLTPKRLEAGVIRE